MDARKRWAALSRPTRRLIVFAAAGEGTLKLAALRDIKSRPADQIRGPKLLWAAAVLVVNSFGAVPVAYFVAGRRSER